jgi:UPF0755 protein
MKKNIFILLVVSIISYVIYIAAVLFSPLPMENNNIEIEIPYGTNFREVADIFSRENIIKDRNLFVFIGRVTGIDRKVRAGYYSIYNSMDHLDLLRTLKKGQIIEYSITILEGDSLREIGEKLAEEGIVSQKDFGKIAKDEDFLLAHDIDAPSAEGYLFPDTYGVPKGMKPEDTIGMMIDRMREKFSPDLIKRASEIGFSEREVLTLASIIEKEAAVDTERPIISGVYHNRLKQNIKLQADPTSIYGIKSFKEKITLSDLKRKTAYNTYMIYGLPPGPIASPSIKSITAALYPADVPYLYFVSNNDGTHHFSVSAAEHQAAVKAYREKKAMESKTNGPQDKSRKQNETT